MYSYFFKVSKEINKVFQVGNSLRVKQETSLLKMLESMAVGENKLHYQMN